MCTILVLKDLLSEHAVTLQSSYSSGTSYWQLYHPTFVINMEYHYLVVPLLNSSRRHSWFHCTWSNYNMSRWHVAAIAITSCFHANGIFWSFGDISAHCLAYEGIAHPWPGAMTLSSVFLLINQNILIGNMT